MIRIILLILVSFNVYATDLDIGIGYTKADNPENMLWYQKEFNHSLDLYSPSFHTGLRFYPKNKVNILVGYKYLGEFSSKAKASASDINYLDWRKGKDEIWPMSTWKGKGSIQGFYGEIQYNFKRFFVRGGGYFHKSSWKMVIPDWRCATKEGRCVGDYHNATYSEPRYKKVRDDGHYQVNWTVGIGKKINSFSLIYNMTDVTSSGSFPAIYEGIAHGIDIVYTF